MAKKKDVDEIVKELVEGVGEILNYRLGIALGKEPPEGHEKYDSDEQKKILKLAEPLIQKHESVREINAKSANDILKLLGQGKLTPKEANEMMSFFTKKTELEEIEELDRMLR